VDHVTLILKPDPDMPDNLSFRSPRIDLPLHPAARPVGVDSFSAMGFPVAVYRSRAEPVSYGIPEQMTDAFAWFDKVFAREGYSRQVIKGRRGNTRTGEFTDWIALSVSPPENPDLLVQLTFRPGGNDDTLLTYRAEEHPIPPRDPAAYLSEATERIEVEYTFPTGPQHTIHRTVTDPVAIRALVDIINALPVDNRPFALGTSSRGERIDLCFIAPGESERKVRVDASHRLVMVNGFPGLQGDLWSLLAKVAPPPKGASGIAAMDC
jgi:hypothetical protein